MLERTLMMFVRILFVAGFVFGFWGLNRLTNGDGFGFTAEQCYFLSFVGGFVWHMAADDEGF